MPHKDNDRDLYPSSSVSNSAERINQDPDLLGILVNIYKKDYKNPGVERLKKQLNDSSLSEKERKRARVKLYGDGKPGRNEVGNRRFLIDRIAALPAGPSDEKRRLLSNMLANDKGPRRQFAVAARKFLSERAAADVVESKRLKGGSSGSRRSAAVIKASVNSQQANGILGRSGLSRDTGRVRNLLNDSNRLGQSGALG